MKQPHSLVNFYRQQKAAIDCLRSPKRKNYCFCSSA